MIGHSPLDELHRQRAGEQALKLFDQLDMNEADSVLAQFDAKTAECEAVAEARAADSESLLVFAIQVTKCRWLSCK